MKEVPGAEIVTFTADVRDPVKAEEAVTVATNRFGRLDVVIANAGAVTAFDKRGRSMIRELETRTDRY